MKFVIQVLCFGASLFGKQVIQERELVITFLGSEFKISSAKRKEMETLASWSRFMESNAAARAIAASLPWPCSMAAICSSRTRFSRSSNINQTSKVCFPLGMQSYVCTSSDRVPDNQCRWLREDK